MEKNMKLSLLRVLRTGIGALLLTIGAMVQAQESIYKALGEDITLVPKYTGSPSEINWKVNGDKLVDMEMRPLDIHFYRLQDRATIGKDGSLTISNLNKGDSGLYKAEVLVNNIIQETNINLIVLDCPAKPIITSKTIDKKTIELTCNSSTPNVKYEWWDNTKSLSNHESYNASRSKKDVTLTCVVYNEACRIRSTELVPLIPESGLSGLAIYFIVLLVLALLFFISCFLVLYFPEWSGFLYHQAVQVRRRLSRCISNITNGEQNGGGTRGETDEPLIGLPEESEICAGVTLKVLSVGKVQSMQLWKDMMSVSAMLGPPRIIKSLCLAVKRVGNPADYTANYVPRGGTSVSTREDPPRIARTAYGGVEINVPNAQNVKTVNLKKGDKIRYHLTVEGLKLQINNITLKPKSFTIYKLKPEDSGTYKVDVLSTCNHSTSNTFNLKVIQTLNKSQTKRKVKLMVKRTLTYDPTDYGLPEDEPIGSIAFHPINITNVASIAWKKDNQPVDTNDNKIKVGQRGDLVINNVTSEDAGSYTVHSEGQTLEQEFILVL